MFQQSRTALLLLFFPLWLFGQDTTRVIKPSVKLITEKELDIALPFHPLDTVSNRLEIFGPQYKKLTIFQDLGNIGTPVNPLLFDAKRETGFSYAYNPFGVYFLTPEETRYVNTKSPYTDITYAQGSNELLFMQLKHSQNILHRWNVGIDFQRITSQGFFLRQTTSMYHYQFHTNYYSKDKRYGLLANATWNRGLIEESGGIGSDSAFESLTGANKQVVTNLARSQTRYRNRSAYLKQYYRWGKQQYSYPTAEDTIYDFMPRLQLSHTFQAEEMTYIFETANDTNALILPHQYYDTGDSTTDSSYYGKLSNTFRFDIIGNPASKGPFALNGDTSYNVFSFSARQEMINVAQGPFIRLFHNEIARVQWQNISTIDRQTNAMLDMSYNLSGYNAGDYRQNAMVRFKLKPVTVSAEAMQQGARPDFAMQLFKNNEFIWNNSFDRVKVFRLTGHVSTNTLRHNFSLSASMYDLGHWVYMGLDGTPKQATSNIQVSRVELSKTFQVWKFFFEHQLYYQQSSSDVLRIPEFSGMIRYYFQSRIFRVLKFQVGFDVFCYSALYANAYNPATRQFYLQDQVKTGNYPVIDPFFVGDIRRASIFFKYEHANQDWIRTGMYSTPHYPLSLSSFRFGVRWRFYD